MTPAQLTSAIAITRCMARKLAIGNEAWADDLVQEAMLCLVSCAGKFDPERGSWEDFARLRAMTAMRAARRRRFDVRGPVSREFMRTTMVQADLDPIASGAPSADRVAAAREELGRIAEALTDEGLRLLFAGELEASR